MQNFLVSGLRGNLGLSLQSLLKERKLKYFNFEKVKKKNFDRFVHLAAKHPIHSNNEIVNSNIILLNQIMNSYEWKNKDLIFISSISVYDERYKILKENCNLQTKGIYCLSKIFGEELISKSNIKSHVLRIPGILGLNKNYSFLSSVVNKLYNNEKISLINGKCKFNSFIDPYDISSFIIDQPKIKNFDIINLSAPFTHRLVDIVYMFKESLRSSSRIKNIETTKKSQKVDTSKAKKYYDFQASKISDTVDRITLQLKK